jgi:hypothetical protein
MTDSFAEPLDLADEHEEIRWVDQERDESSGAALHPSCPHQVIAIPRRRQILQERPQHGLGLWPAAGVAFMLVMIGLLAGRFLPRRAFAVGTVLLGCWLIYLFAALSAG